MAKNRDRGTSHRDHDANDVGLENPNTQDDVGTNKPNIDADTGVISDVELERKVEAETPKAEENFSVEVVNLPKKIVAKEIVGRMVLKCTKKFIPEKDEQGNVRVKDDGSPRGDWEVTPPTPLYTVFGTATGTRSGTSNYGDWMAFTGEFEAVRASDGERYKSGEVILQEPGHTLLFNTLVELRKVDATGGVQFAFEIGKKTSQRWVDTNEGNSYEYTQKSIVNVVRNDPLAALRSAISSSLPKRIASDK